MRPVLDLRDEEGGRGGGGPMEIVCPPGPGSGNPEYPEPQLGYDLERVVGTNIQQLKGNTNSR